jgi:hypothetical protein
VAAGEEDEEGEGQVVSTLLSDVLDIPQSWGADDYVLRLTDSVEDDKAIAATIGEYVVTPALVEAFDRALGLVADAVRTGTSRGAFLNGSFGSGKSHFMAVLYALLRHSKVARAKAELQPVVDRYDETLRDKNILPVAFHLMGADSMEQAVFDGYLRVVEQRNPGAPLPALHQSDAILADAERLRAQMTDEPFLAGLNGSGAVGNADVWSGLLGTDTTWTVESYGAARAAAPGSEARQRLIRTLVESYYSSYTRQAEYVDLETGLAAIAVHAKSLGYDAVVLFLDELVLWLALAVRDNEFFRREAGKLTKLVETGAGSRVIPLISFVARQVDLRRWFADAGASGAEQDALRHAFQLQESRFPPIVLGDDNLPYVANKRVLRRRPDNPDAEQELQDAFARLERRPGIWDVLLDGVNTDERHRGADEAAFQLTYPFSPALISLLRDLAGAMQRERTALKVMQQMLVDRRLALTVDDVIPVGDAYDYIVTGREPLDQQVAALFRSAGVLYAEKLRPLLLAQHGLTEADIADPAAAPALFRTDDRLAKTLLLSAVAPKVPALKELTASRLASLNHGSIKSPLPGHEAAVVLSKVREWERKIPEIRVTGDTRNPVIRVQLSDVDYESVVDNAKGEDNEGRRRELLKGLVREAIGVGDGEPDLSGAYYHPVVWRGSRRTVDLVFGNVRDAGWLSDDHFRARPGTWRVVIDFPFDEPGHSAAEDLARLDRIAEGGPRQRVVAWLPRFLSEDRMREVSRLVILDWLLSGTGERWNANANHLSEVDRAQAKGILEGQRESLRESLRRAVQQAYGAARETTGTLAEDAAHDRTLVSLDPSFAPASPVGADLGAAFGNLIDQAFTATFPAHPRFEPSGSEVSVRDLVTVYTHVERAVADPEGRVKLDGDIAAVRRIAGPLGVGYAAETVFLFGDDRFAPWGTEFERGMARDGLRSHDAVEVGKHLRPWIDAITPAMGLRDEVADLVILAWAALRQRAWYLHGAPISPPRPGAVRPDMELRPEPMPEPGDWAKATSRAEALFGLHVNPYLNTTAVTDLAASVGGRVDVFASSAPGLVPELEQAYRRLGLAVGQRDRLATARAAAQLVAELQRAAAAGNRVRLVETLARTTLPGTEASLANSLRQASAVREALRGFRWERLAPLREAAARGADERDRSAARIIATLRDALEADEIAQALGRALSEAEDAIFAWLANGQPPPPPPPPPGPGPGPVKPVAPSGGGTRAKGAPDAAVLSELGEFLRGHPNERVVVEWRVVE